MALRKERRQCVKDGILGTKNAVTKGLKTKEGVNWTHATAENVGCRGCIEVFAEFLG